MFFVRGGRIRGQRGWVVEKESEDVPELMGHLLQQVYGDQAQDSPDQVPREVLVPIVPAESEALAAWLSTLRGHRVDLRVPQRGDKRSLMETVRRNAEQSLARHKVARAGDLTARSQALQELQESLELPDAPLRIECFDVSHVQGTNVVASMVVFEDGLARKSEYRRFVVRGDYAHTALDGTQTVDDTAAMHEVLTRRFQRYLDEREHSAEIELGPEIEDELSAGDGMPRVHGPIDEVTGRPRKFAYPPNLVVVDGGLPQVNAAKSVLDELGIEDVSLVGLAKRLEEVWVPGPELPADPAADQRGPLPAPAGARRGAPVRHHLPPPAAVQGHDDVRPRRHPGSRRGASQGAAARVRFGQAASRGVGRGDRRRPGHRAGPGRHHRDAAGARLVSGRPGR